MKRRGRQPKPRSLFSPISARPSWPRDYYHYACLKDYDTAVRYFEQARQLLPNSSQIPESLAYVARRRGQWDRSESYFNEAERLDPRNVNLLTQHAVSYTELRRFPEALRKLDQVLNITPDDVDTLVLKAAIAQAEGDLPRAAALLAPLHPNADDARRVGNTSLPSDPGAPPAPIIPRLKEILAKPDPALGYPQWRTALLVRLGAGSCRGPRCRSGNLATGAQRIGTFSQRPAGKLQPH